MKSLKDNKELFIIIGLLACIFMYSINMICGFSLVPDEFGYWSHAASILGIDWREVTSLGSYYSFGYSLILMPILAIFKDGVLAYRVAIFINFLLVVFGGIILRRLVLNIYEGADKEQVTYVCGIAMLYPAWIFYAHMTMTEALLSFLYILVCYLMQKFLEEEKLSTLVLLELVLFYMYVVHMRTVGIIIVAIICVSAHIFKNSHMSLGNCAIAIIEMVVLVVLSHVIKDFAQRNIFVDAIIQKPILSDYSGQIEKIKLLGRLTDWLELISGMVGKIWYLVVASAGLVGWCVVWCVKNVNSFKFFIILAVLAQLSISALFMKGSEWLDPLIYGRYSEHLLPVCIALGLMQVINTNHLVSIGVSMYMISGTMSLMVLGWVQKYSLTHIRGYHVAGISYFLNRISNERDVISISLVLGMLMMTLIIAVVRLSSKYKDVSFMYLVIYAIEIVGIITLCKQHCFVANSTNFQDEGMCEQLTSLYEEGESVGYVVDEWGTYIDFTQMQLRDIPIRVIEAEEENNSPPARTISKDEYTYLIIRNDFSGQGDSKVNYITEEYENVIIGSTFNVYY